MYNKKATIQFPFDGISKTTYEAAEMISKALKERKEEKFDIFFPVYWGLNQISIIHPNGGVLSILDKDETLNYKFGYLARNGEIGITATRSC